MLQGPAAEKAIKGPFGGFCSPYPEKTNFLTTELLAPAKSQISYVYIGPGGDQRDHYKSGQSCPSLLHLLLIFNCLDKDNTYLTAVFLLIRARRASGGCLLFWPNY